MFTRDKGPALAGALVVLMLLTSARSSGQEPAPEKEQPSPGGRTTAETPAAQDAARRIEELEARILQLQKELELQRVSAVEDRPVRTTTVRPATEPGVEPMPSSPSGPEEVILSRVVYKLPAGHAEATAAFLREHAGAPALDARAEGDAVVVTTTPEAQKVIRQLMTLVRQSKPAAAPPKAEEPTPPVPTLEAPGTGPGPGPVKAPTPVTPKTSAVPSAAPLAF